MIVVPEDLRLLIVRVGVDVLGRRRAAHARLRRQQIVRVAVVIGRGVPTVQVGGDVWDRMSAEGAPRALLILTWVVFGGVTVAVIGLFGLEIDSLARSEVTRMVGPGYCWL